MSNVFSQVKAIKRLVPFKSHPPAADFNTLVDAVRMLLEFTSSQTGVIFDSSGIHMRKLPTTAGVPDTQVENFYGIVSKCDKVSGLANIQKAEGTIGYLQVIDKDISINGANWTDTTKQLVKEGAFLTYEWEEGDTIVLTAGTGVVLGIYNVASRLSSNTIVLGDDINGGAGNITDNSIIGVIEGTSVQAFIGKESFIRAGDEAHCIWNGSNITPDFTAYIILNNMTNEEPDVSELSAVQDDPDQCEDCCDDEVD